MSNVRNGYPAKVSLHTARRIRWDGEAPNPVPDPPWLDSRCMEVVLVDIATGARTVTYRREGVAEIPCQS